MSKSLLTSAVSDVVPVPISVEVLHGEFIRIKDGQNINDVKDPASLISIFAQAHEQAKLRMEALAPVSPGAVSTEPTDFEGMKLSEEEVEAIKVRRKSAQYIKDGIDVEHIYSLNDLVSAFKIALVRAEREKLLNQAFARD
ncbi:MAG: hypothetical protein Q7R72_02830 [bacterium]|nr:hypothetical protein [bacterium]